MCGWYPSSVCAARSVGEWWAGAASVAVATSVAPTTHVIPSMQTPHDSLVFMGRHSPEVDGRRRGFAAFTRRNEGSSCLARRKTIGKMLPMRFHDTRPATASLLMMFGANAMGLNNGPTEGLNGKIRTLTRRAYGFQALAASLASSSIAAPGAHPSPCLQVAVICTHSNVRRA